MKSFSRYSALALGALQLGCDLPDDSPRPRQPEPVLSALAKPEMKRVRSKAKEVLQKPKPKPVSTRPITVKEEVDAPDYKHLDFFMHQANTKAISCRWMNAPCEELKKMGIQPHLLKDSYLLFARHKESLESFETFERRIVEQLQPEDKCGDLPYEKRLDNATEVLARSSLGVYQIVQRYAGEDLEYEFRGEEGRRNMYRFLTEKEEQDRVVNGLIAKLAERRGWNYQVMAAEYYGGTKFVKAIKAHQEGSHDHDAFLNGKRYHGYPSVLTYLEGFEASMRSAAEKEGVDFSRLDEKDATRIFRYAVALNESNFDMQRYENDL
ncbi:MAG: hypothetical protein OEY44_02330 [Candidatus Peregrinibacteria bacterium]|nr:hypothetical protein [Candidatus Peregrinibacteria bacterium]